MKDNDGSLRVEEAVINFVETGGSYSHKSIIVDCYFSKEIANVFHTDLDPKSMAKCKKRSDWDKWKEAIETEIASLNKERYFRLLGPHLLVSYLWDINGFSFEREMKTTKW
jgi:hypothetical protein